MANFGKRPINDAAAYKRTTEITFNGERAIDRRPFGFCERFVDPVGNVITLQMTTPGDPKAFQTTQRIRAEKHQDGWIEHSMCPVLHGHDRLTKSIIREFEKMPASLRERCKEDPKVFERVGGRGGEVHAKESCPHVEWLIASRVKAEAEQNAKRNKQRVAEEKRKAEAIELQAAQLEMVKEQIEERKATKRAKKAPTE